MNSNIESELKEIISSYKIFLPKSDIESIEELVDVGEYAVAFENFCTQLHEYDIPVNRSKRNRLEALGTKMELEKGLWIDLSKEET